MTSNQRESLDDVIKRRNHMLEKLFNDCDIHVRLIGERQKPIIVFREIVFLSAHVHNFNLLFMENPDSEKTVKKIKLRKEHGMDHDQIMEIIKNTTHRAVMKICQKDIELCLVGYGYLDSKNNRGRYPVFGRYNHKVFYNKKQVEQLCEEFNNDGYKVRVWMPVYDNKNKLKLKLDGTKI